MGTPDISVCICTFRRPAQLAQLLADLAQPAEAGLILEVVVVDNDPAESGRETVKKAAARAPYPIQYAMQPEQNISLTRNAGLQLARGEWIALIDDDERPEPSRDAGWLARLRKTALDCKADGVFGPVLYDIPADAPDWIRNGGFFLARRYRTGERPPGSDLYSNNALIRKTTLCSEPGPFDPAFGLTGGSDVDLMSRLYAKGFRFVWCDEAVVREQVDPQRLSVRWVLRREWRGARNYATCVLAGRLGTVGVVTRTRLVADWSLKLLASGGLCLLTLPAPKARRVWAWRKVAAQAGKLSAFFDVRYEEYRHTAP